ncbi:hypothetical protein [Roseisolibacter sp. H3M3-2]|uniref:hypothetical protein n=1 Tax=Roseisolibacter sp. H3M3-2 TaxID=3031323 RepID=UPI0023DCD101|nr:hypothetical protein [Roseisolibacter sp. H3M3-2]MDF1503228.1 hypothetical protein [Roseisolibacter sp. H3M3-2]
MRGWSHARRARGSAPVVGPWISAAAFHVTFLAVAVGLCLLVLARPVWLAVGLLLAAGATLRPELVSRWWVLLLLGVSQLWREPSATDGVFYLLLAGVHLLHVVGSLAQQFPWHARVQRAALAPPLRRFVAVQAAAPAAAAGALVAFGGGRGTVTGLSVGSAAALGLVAAVLAWGLRRAPVVRRGD